MAYWIKDESSDPPRIIYTPPESGNMMPPGVKRILYDPTAQEDKRWLAEFKWLYDPSETLDLVESNFSGE